MSDEFADDQDPLADSPRRLERERVLGFLYEAWVKDMSVDEVFGALPVAPELFVQSTVRGVAAHTTELDQQIGAHSTNWDVDRMATIDLIVLRIGAYELVYVPEIPTAVAISEAVELAKRFSTDESGRFVNGLLDALAASVRAD